MKCMQGKTTIAVRHKKMGIVLISKYGISVKSKGRVYRIPMNIDMSTLNVEKILSEVIV